MGGSFRSLGKGIDVRGYDELGARAISGSARGDPPTRSGGGAPPSP